MPWPGLTCAPTPMFLREHRAGPGRAPGDCQLLRYPKACRFAGRTTECTVTGYGGPIYCQLERFSKAFRFAGRTTERMLTEVGGHISRPDTEHASVVCTLDSYQLSIPSFKFSNARAKASSEFSLSNIVQDELRVRSRSTRSTLAVFSRSAIGEGTSSGLLREICRMTRSSLRVFHCATRSSGIQVRASGIFHSDPKRYPSFHVRDSKQGRGRG